MIEIDRPTAIQRHNLAILLDLPPDEPAYITKVEAHAHLAIMLRAAIRFPSYRRDLLALALKWIVALQAAD